MLTLLTELDGVKTNKRQPSCVFCTNRIKMLDPAFLRSGRIGEKNRNRITKCWSKIWNILSP